MNFKYDIRSDEEILRMPWMERIEYYFDMLNNWKEFNAVSNEMRTKKGIMVTILKKRYEETVLSYQKRMDFESKIRRQEARKLDIERKTSEALRYLQDNVVRCLDFLKNLALDRLKEERDSLISAMVDVPQAQIEIEELPECSQENNKIESVERLIYGGNCFQRIDEKCSTKEYVLPVFVRDHLNVLQEQTGKGVMMYRSTKKQGRLAKRVVVTRTRYVVFMPGVEAIYVSFLNKRYEDMTLSNLKITNFIKTEGYSVFSFEFVKTDNMESEPYMFNVCDGGSTGRVYSAQIDKILSLSGRVNDRLQGEVNLDFVYSGSFPNKFKLSRQVSVPVMSHLQVDGRQKFIYIPLSYGDFNYFKDMRDDGGVEILVPPDERKTLYSLELCGLVDSTSSMGLDDDSKIQLELTIVEDYPSYYGNRFKTISKYCRFIGSSKMLFNVTYLINLPNDKRFYGLMIRNVYDTIDLRLYGVIKWTFT